MSVLVLLFRVYLLIWVSTSFIVCEQSCETSLCSTLEALEALEMKLCFTLETDNLNVFLSVRKSLARYRSTASLWTGWRRAAL